MNERFDSPKGPEQEVFEARVRALIDKAHELAPFVGQPVDRFGVFETRFLHREEGYVSVYIPGLAGIEGKLPFVDDAVRIIKRIPEDFENGITLVHMTEYALHETDLKVERKEDVRPFDTDTAEGLGPKPTDDIAKFIEAYQLEQELQVVPIQTADEFDEIEELLDNLDPDDTF